MEALLHYAKLHSEDEDPAQADRLSAFLKTWPAGHSLGMDKKYTKPIHDKGVR